MQSTVGQIFWLQLTLKVWRIYHALFWWPLQKNYETYYRSARLRVLTGFEQFYLCWTIFFIYLSLSWSVSIYVNLIWFSFVDLIQFIIVYLWLSWIILGLFVQKFDILGYLWLFQAILDYHWLSRAYLHPCILAWQLA